MKYSRVNTARKTLSFSAAELGRFSKKVSLTASDRGSVFVTRG